MSSTALRPNAFSKKSSSSKLSGHWHLLRQKVVDEHAFTLDNVEECQSLVFTNDEEETGSPTTDVSNDKNPRRESLKRSPSSPQIVSGTPTLPPPTAPTLDGRGKLNVKHIGIADTPLTLLTWYHSLMDTKWRRLIVLCFGAYLATSFAFAALYYMACKLCGAAMVALYFGVATLAINGGYTGEDPRALNPHTSCYTYRSFLLMMESFIGLIFGGVIVGVCIAKLGKNTSLRHRIVYSDHATVTTHESIIRHLPTSYTFQQQQKSATSTAPNDLPRCAIMFRIAHTHHRPLLHASLSLFIIERTGTAGNFTTCVHEIPFTVREEKRMDPHDRSLLLWYPVTVLHEVTAISPFARYLTYRNKNVVPKAHGSVDLQLVAVVSGADSYTGSNIEGRYAYAADELLLNYHLKPLKLSDDRKLPSFVSGVQTTVAIDCSSFNEVTYNYD